MALIIVEQDIIRALDASVRFYCFQEGRVALAGQSRGFDREAITSAYFGL
jgi:branched-chain amino acid transport system ATP-binding protein